MATLPVWSEKISSRSTKFDPDRLRTTIDLEFTVTGSEDDFVIRGIIHANLPPSYDGLYLQDYETEHLGGGIWDVSAHYGISDRDESVWSFDTTGATAHRTHALQTVSSVKDGGGAAPDLGNAIGYDGENVRGVDIKIPAFKFTEQHTIRKQFLTNNYRTRLFAATATMNNSTFRGFAPGEVLFLGANGSRRGGNDAEITFQFEAGLNIANLNIGGLVLPTKAGFNHAWVWNKKTEDGGNNRIVVRPFAVYESRIYEFSNFANLGIGTA